MAAALSNLTTKNSKLLYKVIFDDNYDRKSREKIRKFSGFSLDGDDLKNKITKVENDFSLNELITISNILLISNEGSANELATRIVSSLNDLNVLTENVNKYKDVDGDLSDIDDSESNLESNDSGAEKNQKEQLPSIDACYNSVKHLASFSDFETFVSPFSGSDSECLETWTQNFEDTALLLKLTELQKLIFAKKSVSGKAKLFLDSERKVHSYSKFKDLMFSEFGDVANSADIHELLSKRRMKQDEDIEQYFLSMKSLGNRIRIEDAALIKYIINGISDEPHKKSYLYGCTNLIEFRAKLKTYAEIKRDENKNKTPRFGNQDFKTKNEMKGKYEGKGNYPIKNNFRNDREKAFQNKPSGRELTCFSCGGKKHVAKNCPDKEKGNRCFNCLNFGHKSYDCPQKAPKPNVSHISIHANSQMKVLSKFNDFSVNSLIDTGSQATLLKKSVFDKLKVEKLSPLSSTLSGFGGCQVEPLGYFKSKIEIDSLICEADVYVVRDEVTTNEAIIGLNVLMQGETVINEKGISIKSKQSKAEEINLIDVLPVNLNTNENEIDIGPNVSNDIKNEIQQLVSNYEPKKTKTTDIKLKICVKSNEPISHQPRRLPFTEKKIVEEQVLEWLRTGIIENSSSEYCSPVVIVKKKDGSPRVCIDFRKLNKIVVKDRFPLPLIEDILDRLQKARIFSTIDLRNGFFHVDVDEESRRYTSFITHEGQYQFLKVPFGYCNSPAVFQRYINKIYRHLVNKLIVLPYLDDVIILSESVEEGLERLKMVLDLSSEYGLEINFKKSQFLKKRIEFLGHVIEEGKIYPSTLKTQAVLNFPEPKSLKQIQSYLGLTGYFRKFIPQYSIIARPLSDLLKNGAKFVFGGEQKHAFELLKSLLAEKPVLAIYNPTYETELHTDASLEGYGSILLQKSPDEKHFHPIYFMSRKTTDAERKYSSYELEILAVIEALKKFRVYLLGIPFKIVTDCSAFQKTMEKRDLATRVARWALLLQEFNYTIEHRPGTLIPHVDALSRAPVDVMNITIENIVPKIKHAQANDEEIKMIREKLATGNCDDYFDRNGVLYKFVDGRELLVIPKNMQIEIIKNAHGEGHSSVKYTEKHIEEYYYIPKLRDKIEKVISSCIHCILVNRKRGKKEGLLHPRQKIDIPLHTYHADHLGPLESTNKNYNHILVIIDAFTKFTWIYPTKSTTSSEVIKKLELQKSIFGSPSQIITDRGTAFTSSEFPEYCSQEEITCHTVTTGLPRANGQVERINQVIISVLAKLSIDNPAQWYKHTSDLQLILNSTYHRSINTSPFELLFGTKVKMKGTDKLKELIELEFKVLFETQRDDLRKNAREQILKVQQENKKSYNLRRRAARSFKIGDLVAIKRTQFGPHLKLKSKFFGPYKITKVKGGETYDVIKEGQHEGPQCTTTCTEYLKPWPVPD